MIKLEPIVKPICQAIKFNDDLDFKDLLLLLGTEYSVTYGLDDELIVTHKSNRYCLYVKRGQYLVNNAGTLSVLSASKLIKLYRCLDVEQGTK